MFYFKFDIDESHFSFFYVAIPISILILSFTFYQVWKIVYEKDPSLLLLYGHDTKLNMFLTLASAMTTVACVISVLIAIYLVEQNHGKIESKLFMPSNHISPKEHIGVHSEHVFDLRGSPNRECWVNLPRHLV
jgi:heme/copper-type cytochrome/quinol oxidase subunit 2